ncbi:MAG: hypothetical protein QOK42_770 [Frankiaceae bacterium]|nr:hypothetical protein [Frankiaceae bacterium]
MRPRLIALLAAVLTLTGSALAAQASDPPEQLLLDGQSQQLTATPAPDLPAGKPCTSTVISHARFGVDPLGYGHAAVGRYTPSCRGPWGAVTMTLTGAVKGTQFDRIAYVFIGRAEVLRTSTPEPPATWSVVKDLSAYSSLLARPQPIAMRLDNVVNGTYTGIPDITVQLSFYKPDAKHPALSSRTQVVGLGNGGHEYGEPAYLSTPGQVDSHSVRFPVDLTRLQADVFTSGHGGCEEFWWAGACSDRLYREVQVRVDGRLAGIAPIYPVIFTGGGSPYAWRPMPAIRALDLRAYRMDLTPFVGMLTDGRAHSIGVKVAESRKDDPNDVWITSTNLIEERAGDGRRTTGRTTAYFENPLNVSGTSLGGGAAADQGGSHQLDITGTVTHGTTKTWHTVQDVTFLGSGGVAAGVDTWVWTSTATANGRGLRAAYKYTVASDLFTTDHLTDELTVESVSGSVVTQRYHYLDEMQALATYIATGYGSRERVRVLQGTTCVYDRELDAVHMNLVADRRGDCGDLPTGKP